MLLNGPELVFEGTALLLHYPFEIESTFQDRSSSVKELHASPVGRVFAGAKGIQGTMHTWEVDGDTKKCSRQVLARVKSYCARLISWHVEFDEMAIVCVNYQIHSPSIAYKKLSTTWSEIGITFRAANMAQIAIHPPNYVSWVPENCRQNCGKGDFRETRPIALKSRAWWLADRLIDWKSERLVD